MAPTRVTRAGVKASMLPKLENLPSFGGKRAAERSPPKKQANKRPALGDVTNKSNIDLIITTAAIKKSFNVNNPIKKGAGKKRSKQVKLVSTSDCEKSDSSQSLSSQDSLNSQSSNSSEDRSELSLLLSSQDSLPDSGLQSLPDTATDTSSSESKATDTSSSESKATDTSSSESKATDKSSSESKASKDKKVSKKKVRQADSGKWTEEDEDEEVYHDTVEALSSPSTNQHAAPADDSILLLSVGSDVARMNERNKVQGQENLTMLHIEDIDAENKSDVYMVPDYAQDIFNYYKFRETKFAVSAYMSMQTDISNSMRAIVVDWMVEVQENFELNHETLYMAIRLVDLYLTKEKVSRDKLQLVAATSLFISCKFDERVPPVLDDFLYVCDDAYVRDEYIQMEMRILKAVGFDIGMPSSYRFLRRFAKCGKINLETLTLARYILESSQMQYDYLTYMDSQLGAACLLLAIRMKKAGDWTPTLVHYSGYKTDDLTELMQKLNTMISLPPYKNLQTIKTKYSHKVFFEVAKTPALPASTFTDK